MEQSSDQRKKKLLYLSLILNLGLLGVFKYYFFGLDHRIGHLALMRPQKISSQPQ